MFNPRCVFSLWQKRHRKSFLSWYISQKWKLTHNSFFPDFSQFLIQSVGRISAAIFPTTQLCYPDVQHTASGQGALFSPPTHFLTRSISCAMTGWRVILARSNPFLIGQNLCKLEGTANPSVDSVICQVAVGGEKDVKWRAGYATGAWAALQMQTYRGGVVLVFRLLSVWNLVSALFFFHSLS